MIVGATTRFAPARINFALGLFFRSTSDDVNIRIQVARSQNYVNVVRIIGKTSWRDRARVRRLLRRKLSSSVASRTSTAIPSIHQRLDTFSDRFQSR